MNSRTGLSSPDEVQQRIISAFLIASLVGGLNSFLAHDVTAEKLFGLAVFVLARLSIFNRDYVIAELSNELLSATKRGEELSPIARLLAAGCDWLRVFLLFAIQAGWVLLGFCLAQPWLLIATSGLLAMDGCYMIVIWGLSRYAQWEQPEVARQFRAFVAQKMVVLWLLAGVAGLAYVGSNEVLKGLYVHLPNGQHASARGAGLYYFGCVILFMLFFLHVGHRHAYLGFIDLRKHGDRTQGLQRRSISFELAHGGFVATLTGSATAFSRAFMNPLDSLLAVSSLMVLWVLRSAYYQRDALLHDYRQRLLHQSSIGPMMDRHVMEQAFFSIGTAGWVLLGLTVPKPWATLCVLVVLLAVDSIGTFLCRSCLAEAAVEGGSYDARLVQSVKDGTFVYVFADLMLCWVFVPACVVVYLKLLGSVGLSRQGVEALPAVFGILGVSMVLHHQNRRLSARLEVSPSQLESHNGQVSIEEHLATVGPNGAEGVLRRFLAVVLRKPVS